MRKEDVKKPWLLKDLDIYEGISETTLCRIAPTAFEKNYRRGTQLYSPHEENRNVYVLKRGEVILYHAKDGKRAIFDTIPPGSVFGNLDPDQKHPTHFAEVTKESLLCVTPMHEFLSIIKEHPEMMLRLMRKMAERLQDYEEKIKMNLETATEKVYGELDRLQKKRKQSIFAKFMDIPLQMTHEQLAEHTNLNRVTVTRSIQRLKKEGLIKIDGKGIISLQ